MHKKKDILEIMELKRSLPLIMQTNVTARFDQIITRNFMFRVGVNFYNREAYIKDRTSCTDPIFVC